MRWWWNWQRSLDGRGLAVECGVLITWLLVYLLRRWLRKKRYFERLGRCADEWVSSRPYFGHSNCLAREY